MDIRLDDKVAIVTGGASGIGKKTCEVFSEAGASLCVADMNIDAAESVARSINENGGDAFAVKVNVGVPENVKKMIDETVVRFGRVDILYNHAGISPEGTAESTSEQDWDQVMDVDLKGVFLGCKYVIPEMKKQGGGVILNTAGSFGIRPVPNKMGYSAAKAGVINLTRSVAIDFARDNIRCNAICPGFVDTPLNTTFKGEALDRYLDKNQPLKGIVQAEDVAYMALILASDKTKMITGQEFVIDGGQESGLVY